MNPMFLAYKPPQMLPTVTMNPTTTATAAAKAKRSAGPEAEELIVPLNINAKHIKRNIEERGIEKRSLIQRIDLNILWWTGVGMVIFGGTAYML
jgi:hypothetical protein